LDFLDHRQLRQVPAVATLTDYTSVCGDFQLIHRYTGQPCVPPVAAETCAACLHDRGSTAPRAQDVEAWRRRNLAVLNECCHGVWVQTPYQGRRLVAAGLRATQIISDRAAYAIPSSWRPRPPVAGPPSLLFLGRASAEKGLHVLLEAFLAWRRPARLRVVTTPDDDAYERRLRRVALADPRIEWLPPVARDDLIGLLHGAHALVVPSQWDENHPMVMQYAMAVGVPVLCSAVASLAHLAARPGVHLVEGYHDAAAWVHAIDDLASRPPHPTIDPTAPARRAYAEFVDTTVDVYRKATDR
jgi:glycosyltransferase involved in cell wall biosynthesis